MVSFPENQQFQYIQKELDLSIDQSTSLVTQQHNADGSELGNFALNFNEGDISFSALGRTSRGLQAETEMTPLERIPALDMPPLEMSSQSMSPMKALPPPPPPPVRHTRTEETASRPMHMEADTTMDPRVLDEAYEATMTALI